MQWKDADVLRSQGHTVKYVAADGKAAGLIAVADPLQNSTAAVVNELRRAGLTIIMLTGNIRPHLTTSSEFP